MKDYTKNSTKPVINDVNKILSKEADIQINENVHRKYVNYHSTIDIGKYHLNGIIKQSKQLLFNSNTPNAVKRKLLFLLGHFATKECFEILSEYVNNPDIRLKQWAILALKDLQFKIENQVYEEGRDMVMSPMGGKGDKFRYFVVICSKHNKSLTGIKKRTINKDLQSVASKTNSQVEDIEFGKNYIFFSIFIPFDIAVGEVVEGLLKIAAKKKGILKYHYFAVNTHKITEKEIQKYLESEEVKQL